MPDDNEPSGSPGASAPPRSCGSSNRWLATGGIRERAAERAWRRHQRAEHGQGVGGVAERLATMMRERFPGVAIAGTSTLAFGSAAELCNAEIAERINAAWPDIVWVGMSSPKQDQWMACMRPLLQAPVLIGVGAAFDFHIGRVKQAPRWMMRSGLEWLFRLTQEPGRLWRRYLIDNPWFLYA